MNVLNTQRERASRMNLYLEDEYNFFEKHEDLFEEIQKVIAKCLEVEKVPYESEISLTVVDKEEIRSINHEYRDIDRATDVLSFPQIDPESNGIIDWEKLDETEVMNYDTNHIMLGDIVLCYEVADEQAKSYGHSLKREVCFLVAHRMFHLLGYDHMNEEDEKLMIAKQNEVLSDLGINR